MTTEDFPNVSKRLLDSLEVSFPLSKPQLDWDERRVWMMSGERNVVDFLKEKYEIQQEKGILSSKHE